MLRIILARLFPSTAVCRQCGRRLPKNAMHYLYGYGYFCDEAEASRFWWEWQW